MSKKHTPCPLIFEMFRESDSVGLPAEMRLNKKFFQSEHFLKCFSAVVDAAKGHAMGSQAIRLDLVGGVTTNSVVGPSLTPSPVQGAHSTSRRGQNCPFKNAKRM